MLICPTASFFEQLFRLSRIAESDATARWLGGREISTSESEHAEDLMLLPGQRGGGDANGDWAKSKPSGSSLCLIAA